MLEKDNPPRKGCVYDDIGGAVAGTECTGLMPTLPEDEDELLSYQELHGMEIPKAKHEW